VASQQPLTSQGLWLGHLVAAASRAFCQSALNCAMPLSVSG
jgi:hypothetical protein